MAVNSAAASAAPQITGAIRQAARSTGISFEYLLTTARIESNLNPAAQASTSSAKGLYQFIEQTWLGTMKGEGAALGYGRLADAIVRNADGRFEVPDPAMRNAIMRLRSDPSVSATMAGAFTRSNANQLSAAIGRQPSEGELYLAHFLGSDGAGKMIANAKAHPRANAAAMFPAAAAANPGIFYDGAGKPRSVSAVYAKLTGRFEIARAVNFAPAPQPAATAAAMPAIPDTAGVAQAFADATPPAAHTAETRPLFQSMFTDGPRQGVTRAVSSLWAPAKSEDAQAARGLDLFSDSPSDIRKLFRGSV